MKLPRLFKEQKASSFRYTPRYYDEDKKKKEARRRDLKRIADKEKTAEGRAALREEFNREADWTQAQTIKANKGTRFRFIIILGILSILTILFLKKLGIPIFGAS